MTFGINWLFAATFMVAAILAGFLYQVFTGFLVSFCLVPVFLATIARVELNWKLRQIMAGMVLFCVLLAPAFTIWETSLAAPSIVLGGLGGLVFSPIPIGLFLLLLPFMDNHSEQRRSS